ncbi:uncharacterized protein LOC106667777 isoform X2 [Cimex lectularius]|uniref:DUF7153 domain-containing protein n=1 Tax=Cimex lectularius TaxID=79782 RepID=A0A8I6TI93_CIMLE|nr:uncharacterized protein LOC106667777 isoform X2 [Cimex lectularius]
MNILFRKNFSGEGGGGGGKEKFGKLGNRPKKGKTGALLKLKNAPLQNYNYPKVSFTNDNQGYAGRTTKPISLHPVPKAEITELKTLDKDCFIIPVASVDRFLPAGVPMPLIETKQSQLSVVEVDDPKLCVLIHLMTQMEPIEPILESPLSMPLVKQKSTACDLLTEVGASRTAMEGMLLANLEKNAEFPFISYYVINKAQTDPGEFFHNCRAASLRKFDPKCLRYSAAHTFDLFNEVATIARPPLDPTSKRPRSNATGFIVSVYKVFEGDDGENFEKNWLYWTGARMIYRSLPKSVGLRRITLHKSVSNGDKLYLLLVECSNFLHDLTAAAILIPALRARLCGYTGLYRTTAVF